MRIIRSLSRQRALGDLWRRRGMSVGFVPTMGCLHAGHMSLVRFSLASTVRTVVSIFVNPMQFGPREDLARYPRALARDKRMLAKAGVHALFVPPAGSMYPRGFATSVKTAGGLTERLCGRFRPRHFEGVATVVAKLLNIVRPDVLFLGKKDAQQARILEQVTRDLNFPCAVRICPTVREPDGLAMSSRNVYLSPAQRKAASYLFQALQVGRLAISRGERDARAVRGRMRDVLAGRRGLRIQYLEIVGADTLEPIAKLRGRILLALAAKLGGTRLIDNLPVEVPGK